MDYTRFAQRRAWLAFIRTWRAYFAPRTLHTLTAAHAEQLAYLARMLARSYRGQY